MYLERVKSFQWQLVPDGGRKCTEQNWGQPSGVWLLGAPCLAICPNFAISFPRCSCVTPPQARPCGRPRGREGQGPSSPPRTPDPVFLCQSPVHAAGHRGGWKGGGLGILLGSLSLAEPLCLVFLGEHSSGPGKENRPPGEIWSLPPASRTNRIRDRLIPLNTREGFLNAPASIFSFTFLKGVKPP